VASEQSRQAHFKVIDLPGNRARWMMLALLMALAGISHFNRISMSIAGNHRIMEQYGIVPTRMGWVYSAFLITYTACMIPGGWFIDRFGTKAALMTVGFGSALFGALTGVVGLVVRDSGLLFVSLLIVRGLAGIASAPLHPGCARVVGHWAPPGRQSQANGLINGSALIGIAATPLVFGGLIDRFDWPTAFFIASAATVGWALVWTARATEQPMLPADAKDLDVTMDEFAGFEHPLVANEAPTGWGDLLFDRSLVLLTLSYAAVGYFQYLFFYWMDYYFLKVLALPEGRSKFYSAIPPLAMALGMPLGGWLSDRLERSLGPRWGGRLVPMAGMFAGAGLLVLGILARETSWIVTWFALALGAMGASEGPFWATAIKLGGRRGGSAAGLLNTGGNIGGLLAPVVTPWVGAHYGWPAAIGVGSLVCLVGVGLWLGIDCHKTLRRSPPR
jgi:MFS family permease